MTFLPVLGPLCPSIEVALDVGNPTAASPNWVDITPWLVAYSRAPVRSNEFDQPGPASGSITLRNDDSRFTPDNAGLLANLVPNPSFEVDLSGWNAFVNAGGTLNDFSRVTTVGKFGTCAAHFKWTNGTAVGRTGEIFSASGLNGFPLVGGARYTVSYWVNVISNPADSFLQADVDFYDATGAAIGSSAGGPAQPTPGVWTRIFWSFTAPANAAFGLAVALNTTGLASAVSEFYIDGFSVAPGEPTTYIDGTQPDCRWAGTAHASASYQGGPYYPNLKPYRRVRVRAQWAGVTYNRFYGYVTDWPQSWSGFGFDQSVTLALVDNLAPLETFDLAGVTLASKVTGPAIQDILTAAYAPNTPATALDAGRSTVVGSTGPLPVNSFALQRIKDIAASENGVCYAAGDGTVTFHDRRHRLVFNAAVQSTIGDGGGAEIPYVDPTPLFGDVWPIVQVTPNGGTVQRVAVAAAVASYWGRTLNFPAGGTYLVADPNEALSAAQYLSSRYSTPTTRVNSVTLVGAAAPALWPQILALDTSSKVVFRRRYLVDGVPAGPLSVTEFVEGYGDDVVVGQDWRVHLPLSPADIQAYWVLGDSVYGLLGQTTRLSY